MNQILLINKPKDWTSFDVVAKIRNNYQHSLTMDQKDDDQRQVTNNARKRIKVGHAGTLDPFATGLLIVLVGDATKEQDSFMKLDKEYEATIFLGATSSTGDTEGNIKKISNDEFRISIKTITKTLKQFTGEIEQIPPAYSAIKINGKRAYELARAGKEVKLKSRKITIYNIDVLEYKYPELKIRTKVSSGTYIRSLGKDIGETLGCGAYLTDLKRTKIGKYNLKDAKEIEAIIS